MEKALIIAVDASELWRIKAAAMSAFPEICRMVNEGKAEFFRINECYFVTFAQGNEFVISCAQGKGLVHACQILHSAIKQRGFTSIRVHLFKQSTYRLMKRCFNLIECETVYKLAL